MDLARLRTLLQTHIVELYHRGHKELPSICARLGMPPPPPPDSPDMSRRRRMQISFDEVKDGDLASIAERYLREFSPGSKVRNEIQEILWAEVAGPRIAKRYRREVAQSLDIADLFINVQNFDTLLRTLWNVEDDIFTLLTAPSDSLLAQIERHVYLNSGDWSPEFFFEKLGAYECTDKRFVLFLEELASGAVRPNEDAQRAFVARVNKALHASRVELREAEWIDGYPSFRAVSLGEGVAGKPKNLIFASHKKPDIRIRDVVNSDIEILTRLEDVLVYDWPLTPDGLRWCDLQAWWEDLTGERGNAAKTSLYKRLQRSMPSTSPPQQFFFRQYFVAFGDRAHGLPALLPEVWLHWDPKAVKARGAEAMTRFRMDFLLLLPGGHRVVVEVDGQQHYADADGRARPDLYAKMVAADRDLRLLGYEVYRFGAKELAPSENAKQVVHAFFMELFKKHSIL